MIETFAHPIEYRTSIHAFIFGLLYRPRKVDLDWFCAILSLLTIQYQYRKLYLS